MAELYSYANPDGGAPPRDAQPVMATYHYLSALQKLFEDGFLCNRRDDASRVKTMQDPVLRSIQEGFDFFRDWWIALNEESKKFSLDLTNELIV